MQSQFSAKSQGTWPKKLFNLTGAMMMVGGGGGTALAPSPGGGGAGGMIYMPSCIGATVMSGLESNTLDVTIGAGGGGQTGSPPDRGSQVQAGNNTILGSNLLIALGGGAGFTGGVTASIPGGSGGGGGGEAPSQTGGSTTQVPSMPSPLQPFGFGNAGGTGSACGGSPDRQGAGGGGAGAAGTPASSGSNGGSGKSVTPIFGSAPQPFYIANSSVAGVTVCGTFAGGGAGRQDPQRGGTGTYSGGSGGGGNAYSPTSSPSPTRGCGTANSGGGGGAGTCANGPTGVVLTFGGQGGSGYVLIKTPAPALPAPGVFSISPGANAIVTQPCGAKIAKFAASGTLTFE